MISIRYQLMLVKTMISTPSSVAESIADTSAILKRYARYAKNNEKMKMADRWSKFT